MAVVIKFSEIYYLFFFLVKMTPFQRRLYATFTEDLLAQKSVANPLKAFAVCCKIWNHPDVLCNFLSKYYYRVSHFKQ